MRRRRGAEVDDSLELLLDTICNIFGGVIFIAMLLAVTARDVSNNAPSTEVPDVPREALVVAIEEAAADSERIARPGETELAERRGIAADLQRDIDAAKGRLGRAGDTLARVGGKSREIVNFAAESDKRREELERELAELRKVLTEEEARRTAVARLPVMRKTTKDRVHMILIGDRAYFVYLDRADPRIADARDVEEERTARGTTIIRPRAGGGFDVSRPASSPRVRELFGRIDPRLDYLYLMVYPDSFSAFRSLMTASLQAGVEYDIVLMRTGETVELFPTDDHGGTQ